MKSPSDFQVVIWEAEVADIYRPVVFRIYSVILMATSETSAPVPWPTFDNGEDYYHYLKCQVLEKQREFLCQHLRHDRYFPYLRSQRVLDAEMCEDIELPPSLHAAKVGKFVDCLINQGGPHAFDHFVESLKKRGTEGEWFIIRQLVKSFEQVKATSKAVLSLPKQEDDGEVDNDIYPPPAPGCLGGPIIPTPSMTNDTEIKPMYLHLNPTHFLDSNYLPPS